MLIIVQSRVFGFDARRNIRETWGETCKLNPQCGMIFILGEPSSGKVIFQNLPFSKIFLIFDSNENYFEQRILSLYPETSSSKDTSRVQEEAQIYKDMLQESFIDSYANLSLKSLFSLR